MRIWSAAALAFSLAVTASCERTARFDGPTVNKFTGKLVHDGKPVTFPGEEVELKVFHEKGQSFGVPIKQDGTFEVGWMPIGKYSANLIRKKSVGGKASVPNNYGVPGGLTIADGQTEYVIELGKAWKP